MAKAGECAMGGIPSSARRPLLVGLSDVVRVRARLNIEGILVSGWKTVSGQA